MSYHLVKPFEIAVRNRKWGLLLCWVSIVSNDAYDADIDTSWIIFIKHFSAVPDCYWFLFAQLNESTFVLIDEEIFQQVEASIQLFCRNCFVIFLKTIAFQCPGTEYLSFDLHLHHRWVLHLKNDSKSEYYSC